MVMYVPIIGRLAGHDMDLTLVFTSSVVSAHAPAPVLGLDDVPRLPGVVLVVRDPAAVPAAALAAVRDPVTVNLPSRSRGPLEAR